VGGGKPVRQSLAENEIAGANDDRCRWEVGRREDGGERGDLMSAVNLHAKQDG
jgi:hypothetical protein